MKSYTDIEDVEKNSLATAFVKDTTRKLAIKTINNLCNSTSSL